MKNTTISNAVKLAIHKQKSQAEIDEVDRDTEEMRKHLIKEIDVMMAVYFRDKDNEKTLLRRN